MKRRFTEREWFTLPLKFRQRWWSETAFNTNEPSAELLAEVGPFAFNNGCEVSANRHHF